jgi:hypothetical protein
VYSYSYGIRSSTVVIRSSDLLVDGHVVPLVWGYCGVTQPSVGAD